MISGFVGLINFLDRRRFTAGTVCGAPGDFDQFGWDCWGVFFKAETE
jgi:hypothetical protein